MKPITTRCYAFDGDVCEVRFVYDEKHGKYFGDYPDFEETPRYTPSGMKWVNVFNDACPNADDAAEGARKCIDCGSCKFFLRQSAGDLIGVCSHPAMRKKQ